MDHMLRPEATVLGDSALIPASNLVRPVPNRFTHELRVQQFYYFDATQHADAPSGSFPAGTELLLVRHEGGDSCHVIDARGMYVRTAFAGLRVIAK